MKGCKAARPFFSFRAKVRFLHRKSHATHHQPKLQGFVFPFPRHTWRSLTAQFSTRWLVDRLVGWFAGLSQETSRWSWIRPAPRGSWVHFTFLTNGRLGINDWPNKRRAPRPRHCHLTRNHWRLPFCSTFKTKTRSKMDTLVGHWFESNGSKWLLIFPLFDCFSF